MYSFLACLNAYGRLEDFHITSVAWDQTTMMQSAAALTETPGKGLPDILGVPMQRKVSRFYSFVLKDD